MQIVTWNTQWCCGLDGIVSPQRIVDGARALADFDVLCLQEIAQGFDTMAGGPGDQPAQVAALLPGFQVFFGAAVDEFTPEGRRQRFGNLIATRLPVAQVQHHPLPWPPDGATSSMPRMCTVLTVVSPKWGAVRIMTTHLEYYSAPQRLAQANALQQIHAQACLQNASPPAAAAADAGTPFQAKAHTPHAILCGDFNMAATDGGYAAICAPFSVNGQPNQLHDAWTALHDAQPQPPTFRIFDRRYGPEPVACDFVFVSDSLVPHVRRISIDGQTQASDHQPVAIELD